MSDKSPLRQARESAGLSRAKMAEKLGTTVHKYWHAEMPPYDADPELVEQAWKVLGGTPKDPPSRTDVGQPRGSSTRGYRWVCRECGHVEVTPIPAVEVWHVCLKRKGKDGSRVRLVLDTT